MHCKKKVSVLFLSVNLQKNLCFDCWSVEALQKKAFFFDSWSVDALQIFFDCWSKNVHVNFASKKGAVTPLGKSKDWTQEEEDEEELKMKMNLNPKMVKGKKFDFIDLAMNLVKGNGQRQMVKGNE